MRSAFTQPSSGVTALIINPLLTGVIETFSTMLDCSARRSVLEHRPSDEPSPDLTALIAITGRVKGTVGLGFRRPTALAIAQRMLGEPADSINPQVIDALGEITNMVTGFAKSKLDMGLNIGLPTVSRRDDLRIRFPDAAEPLRLHFASELGPFFVDFGFVANKL